MSLMPFEHTLCRAAQAGMTELACERDPEIAAASEDVVTWIITSDGVITGSVRAKTLGTTAELVVRWAMALGLDLQPLSLGDALGAGDLAYRGQVGNWKVHVKGNINLAKSRPISPVAIAEPAPATAAV